VLKSEYFTWINWACTYYIQMMMKCRNLASANAKNCIL